MPDGRYDTGATGSRFHTGAAGCRVLAGADSRETAGAEAVGQIGNGLGEQRQVDDRQRRELRQRR
ncbi:hypothetical protein [Nocardia sp. NPDC051463]|uniref:hypothetical protein n=1 Tax=Nocardia sp. NPDC051463 TaxID=3154845 RepID=UPI003447F3FA